MNDLARELTEAQGLAQGHELEPGAPPCLIMHATERYPPRLVEACLRCLSTHLRRKIGVLLDAVEVGIGPHVDDDVQDADFNETQLNSQKHYDQYTGLEFDPVGAAAARQADIAPTPGGSVSAYGTEDFRTRWVDCNKGDEQRPERRSRLVVQETRQTSTTSASRISQLSHQVRHRSKLFVCFAPS